MRVFLIVLQNDKKREPHWLSLSVCRVFVCANMKILYHAAALVSRPIE